MGGAPLPGPPGLAPAEEAVLVVSVDHVRAAGVRPGFTTPAQSILATLLRPNAVRPMARSLAEGDPRSKQLVCYVVLWSGERVFHYRRTAHGGERRLRGLRSIGIGGHLNAADAAGHGGLAGLERALRRELAEEVVLPTAPAVEYVGLIDDDATEVSRVHLGIVALARLPEPQVELRDPALTEGEFSRPSDLLARRDEFETWSQICLPALLDLEGARSSMVWRARE